MFTPTPPLAVAIGDPAGIGPEIVAKAWVARARHQLPPFFAIGDADALGAAMPQVAVERIASTHDVARVFAGALPVLHVDDGGPVVPGQPTLEGARVALASLECGIGLARSGAAAALVTGPVSKAQLYKIGFTHPGQTEFVAKRCGVARDNVVMMLAGPDLRTVPVTIHVPLAEVPSRLTIELLLAKARTTARGLTRNFAIAAPRIAVAALNPHAGEDGTIGREEIDIIAPAVAQLRHEGIDANGPYAADSLFHPRARADYDAVLCMYHDQALVPIKALYFDEGVNMTLGLPIVRTSPDHGTAFGIAGTGAAHPGAMIAAIAMAAQASDARRALAA